METFQISDLPALAKEEKPPRFAVIGQPIAHSLSPGMHQPALDELAQNARYIRVEVPPGEVLAAFKEFNRNGFKGINVTIPHKEEALRSCHTVDKIADAMGVVNTVTIDGDRFHGSNTDGPGFSRAIREDFGVDFSDLDVVLIGAGGGAGRALATQAIFEQCPHLTLANRSLDKIEALRDHLTTLRKDDRLEGPGNPIETFALSDPHLEEVVRRASLLINTTSLGLKPGDPSPIPTSWLEPHHLVYDTIYNPHRTPLLNAAERAGARIANGLSMLLHQGAISLEHWLGQPAPIEAMRRGLQSHLEKK